MSSFNHLSFTLAYHTLHIYGLSLIVKVCVLAACSPPGSVCLYWISCYAQDEMAYHLNLILCTSDAVTACTPVTLFFPLGVRKKTRFTLNGSTVYTLSRLVHIREINKSAPYIIILGIRMRRVCLAQKNIRKYVSRYLL